MAPIQKIPLHLQLVALSRGLKVALMLAADILALPLCFFIALLLRAGEIPSTGFHTIIPTVLISGLTLSIFIITGLYRAVIRFIDQHLLISSGIGLAISVVLSYIGKIFVPNFFLFPDSTLIIYWFVTFSYVVSSRLIVRTFLRKKIPSKNTRTPQTIAIYGAGEAGVQLVHAIRNSEPYRPVCFFDDKRTLDNHNVAGLNVFHTDRIVQEVHRLGIELIILAIPSSSPARRRQVMHSVSKAGIMIKTLQNLIELHDGKITADSIRDIRLEDLLGREPVPPQMDLFAHCIQNKNILVTGAGGSIGSELCRQIITLNPNTLHILDHSEYALYTIEQEFLSYKSNLTLKTHLGSVCDAQLIDRLFKENNIHTLYHAAAYKHVPIVEANMAEGIRNNVVGAQVIATAAHKYNVDTCVLISTDKAVRPTNIMGASKRIAELIFQAAAQSNKNTTYCMVRFGNVLGSSGSVVPLFKRQIQNGGPLTLTHPDITRYFMLIPEAAQLVIQAGAMAKGGEVFVLDMGEAIKIIDLAQTMIQMSGLTEKNIDHPDGDIAIQFIGLRPGEKLYEELLIGNHITTSAHPRILRAQEHMLEQKYLDKKIDELLSACEQNHHSDIKKLLHSIVQEYNEADYSSRVHM